MRHILLGIFITILIVGLCVGGIFYYKKFRLTHINHIRNAIFKRQDESIAVAHSQIDLYTLK